MTLDVIAEIEKLKAEYADNFAKAEVLDKLIVSGRPFGEFKLFYDAFPQDWRHVFRKSVFLDRLFTAEAISAYDFPQLMVIHEMMSSELHYLHAMRYAAQIVMEPRIPAERRALFWHVIRAGHYPYSGAPVWMLGRSVFMDNPSIRESLLNRTVVTPELEFIKNTSDNTRVRKITGAMGDAIQKDSVPILEMNRTLEGRSIGISLLIYMLWEDAAQCFAYMLSHYPKRIFELRSPEEWLFMVCRCAREKLAVAAVNELERQFPGIVRRAHDPWGNTPLWNTLANARPVETLQTELIRLGCDPDEKNEWGLSYRLVRDNDPENPLKHEASRLAV